MGCLVCNVAFTEKFSDTKNPFYCKTTEEYEEFLAALADNIAVRHPKLCQLIAEARRRITEERAKN